MESLEVFEDSPEIDQTSDIENWQMESGDVDMKVNMSKKLVSGKPPKFGDPGDPTVLGQAANAAFWPWYIGQVRWSPLVNLG